MPDRPMAVVGAGITGTVLAMRLADRRHVVDLIESRPRPDRSGSVVDRSINLALSTRGLDALARVGLADAVRAAAVPMRGRMLHAADGRQRFIPYGTDPTHHLLSVGRRQLNLMLLEGIGQRESIDVSFASTVLDVDTEAVSLTIQPDRDRSTENGSTRHYSAIFGTDGINSTVRQAVGDPATVRRDDLEHGYKEVTLPAGGNGHQFEPEALHIWPRGTHMLIALPNLDGSFTCTVFWPRAGEVSFDDADDQTADRFEYQFPDAAALIADLGPQLARHPVGTLTTIACPSWHVDDRVLILGDAAHAVVPFYGQGANAGLEDTTLLLEAIDQGGWPGAFARFASARRPDTDALARLAIDNYVEMRDRVASPWFQFSQSVHRQLHRMAPDRFVPLYTMVTFSRMPYADAVARDRAQRHMLLVLALVVLAVSVMIVLALVLAWLS